MTFNQFLQDAKKYINDPNTSAEDRKYFLSQINQLTQKGSVFSDKSHWNSELNNTSVDVLKKAFGQHWSPEGGFKTPAAPKLGQSDIRGQTSQEGGKGVTQIATKSSDPVKTKQNATKQTLAMRDYDNSKTKEDAVKAINDAIDAQNAQHENGMSDVADIPHIDGSSSATLSSSEPSSSEKEGVIGTATEKNSPMESTSPNIALWVDHLGTTLRNLGKHRTRFGSAYGKTIEGRDVGNEESELTKQWKQNMQKGLDRRNARLDSREKTYADIEDTVTKGTDSLYRQSRQDLTKDVSPTTTSYQSSSSYNTPLGGYSSSNAGTSTNWNAVGSKPKTDLSRYKNQTSQ